MSHLGKDRSHSSRPKSRSMRVSARSNHHHGCTASLCRNAAPQWSKPVATSTCGHVQQRTWKVGSSSVLERGFFCTYNALTVCEATRWDDVAHVFRFCALVGLQGTQEGTRLPSERDTAGYFSASDVVHHVDKGKQETVHCWLVAPTLPNSRFSMSSWYSGSLTGRVGLV